MTDTGMTNALAATPDQKIGTILHIGAGGCDALQSYLAANPRAIVLVEPNPLLAAALQTRTAGIANLTVVAAAIAGTTEDRLLTVFSIAALSTLQQPTGLLTLYPGLRSVDQLPVRCITLETMLAEIQPEVGLAHWLIAEAPGAERDILQALTKLDVDPPFDRILFRASREALFEGSMDLSDLLRGLRDVGYVIEDAWGDTAPEWQWFRLSRDPQRQALMERSAELAALTAERETLRQTATESDAAHQLAADNATVQLAQATHCAQSLAAEVAALTADRDTLRQSAAEADAAHRRAISEVDAQLALSTKRAEALAAEVAALTADRDTLRQSAAEADAAHRRAISEVDAQLALSTKRAEALAAEVAALMAMAEALTADRDALRQNAADTKAAYSRLEDRLRKYAEMKAALDAEVFGWRKKLEAAEKVRAALTDDLTSKTKDLSLALQSQAVERADYRDLQSRYGLIYDTSRRQEDLLLKLSNRLSEAAIHLQRLTVGQAE